MKFFLLIFFIFSYKSYAQQLESKASSEKDSSVMLELTKAQASLSSKERKAILKTQIYNRLSEDSSALRASKSFYNGNLKDFYRQIKNQELKEKSGVTVNFSVRVNRRLNVGVNFPVETLYNKANEVFNNSFNLEKFLNEKNGLGGYDSFRSYEEKLKIADDIGSFIYSCHSDPYSAESCERDKVRNLLVQTFFSDLSPENVLYSKEGQLFLNVKIQKEQKKTLETLLKSTGEGNENFLKAIEEFQKNLTASSTPRLDDLVSRSGYDDDPYIAKLSQESDFLLEEVSSLGEKNLFIKSALELKNQGVSNSEILESLKQEINKPENQKGKKELEKAYEGIVEIDKLQKQKDVYRYRKTIGITRDWFQAVFATINALHKLGVFPDDFPIKKINDFEIIFYKSLEISEIVGTMIIGSFIDPTGITAVMNAVGVIADVFMDRPTFEEAVMETLGQILEGQKKIIENQQQIMKGIKHLDSRFDGIDEKLDIIIDILEHIHKENRYSYQALDNNINRLRDYLQEQESIEKKKEKTDIILSAIDNYQVLSHYGYLFDKSIARELSLADDKDINYNLVSEALTNSESSLNEMMTFSTVTLFESNITEFHSSVNFILFKDKNSKTNEWRDHITSLYETLDNKNLLESLNFLYPKNSNLLSWLDEELRLRDMPEVKKPYKIGHPFYQDEIFSASVLLASVIPSLEYVYDTNNKVDEICLKSQKIEQASKDMRAELPKAWKVYQDYTKQLLRFHSKKNPELLPAMEEVAANQYVPFEEAANVSFKVIKEEENEEDITISFIFIKPASRFEEQVFLFQLPVNPEKQEEFLKENPSSKALFDKKYDNSDNYCDDHYHPKEKSLKEKCVKASDLRKELINLLTQLQIGNELEKFELSIESDEDYKKRLDYKISFNDHNLYSEDYKSPSLTLTGIDLNHQKHEIKISLNRKWDHIIMALGYWNHHFDTRASLTNDASCRNYAKEYNIRSLKGGFFPEMPAECVPVTWTEKYFVPDREAFLKDLKKQFDDFWPQRSYEYLFYESELMANWMKAKLAFESMAYMAYGDFLMFEPELSDLRNLFNVTHSVNGINPEAISSFFESLKKIYPDDSNEDRSLQSLVSLESYWKSFPVGLGYPEARNQALELASQNESLQLDECNRLYRRMSQ